MRRIQELLLMCSSAAVVVASLLDSPVTVQAEELDEAKVRARLLQRFDENRNDKLESGEARQARARLKLLLEDQSDREINIQTWRDDVREILQALDQDGDNRLTVSERDDGQDLLDRLIPTVEPNALKERAASTKSGSANRASDRVRRADRATSGHSGSYGGNFGSAIGGGGFGNFGGGHPVSVGSFKGLSSTTSEVIAVSDLKTSGVSQIRPGKGDPGIGVSHVFAGVTKELGTDAKPQDKIAGSTSDSGASPGVDSKPSSSPAGSSTIHVPANDGLGGGLAAPKTSAAGGIKTVPHNPQPNF